MDLFSGNVKIWNVPIKTFTLPNRFETYKNVMELIRKEKPCEIEPMERIGSASTMGEVYSHKIDNQMIAIKILPIVNSKSVSNNLKEIELAREVSLLVLDGKSKYFPLVYFDTFCDSTFFYEHNESKFAKQSLNYQQYNYVKTNIHDKELISKLDTLYKNKKDMNVLFEEAGINELIPNNIQSHLLFSELAYTDLRNYLSEKIDVNILNQIIIQVLQAINELQSCGIIHNDLHLGNILLLFNPLETINILIHDFGKSVKLDIPYNFTNLQFKKDIITFFNEITAYIAKFYDKNSENYTFIKNNLDSSILLLDEMNTKSPVLEILKLWNFE